MSLLRRIFDLEFNSAIGRAVLSMYYHSGNVYSIPFGPLKGIKIWYDRTVNYHAVLGFWERQSFALMDRLMPQLAKQKKNLVIFDIGANIGLFSLYFSRIPNTRVVMFEPAPDTYHRLNKNLEVNGIENFEAQQAAVGNSDGTVEFFLAHHHKSSLSKEWASANGRDAVQRVTVHSTQLDTFLISRPELVPDLIKIDVEGGGAAVLEGSRQLLEQTRPVVLFESHTPAEDKGIMHVLENQRYKAYRINTRRWITCPNEGHTNPDGVWGTMLLVPAERVSEFYPILQDNKS